MLCKQLKTSHVHVYIPHTCSAGARADEDQDVDAKLYEDLEYSAMRGVRYRASCALLGDDGRMRTLLMLALAIEPLRFLSAWWMRRAREFDKHHDRIPFLDMMFAPASPLQVARQYISTLMCAIGDDDRRRLVWHSSGCNGYLDWCDL